MLAKAIAQPAVRALFAFVVVFSLFVLYGSTHFYRDPGSIYFDPNSAYTRLYSNVREQQAQKFIETATSVVSNIPNDGNAFPKAGNAPSFCVAIPTFVRKGLTQQYVEISIASTLEGLLPAERAEMSLQIFFATVEPSNHPTFSEPWLRNVTDKVFSYKDIVSPEEFRRLSELETQNNLQEKSVADYSLALEHCYNSTSSPYIAVFEGDVVVADSWLSRSFLSLNNTVHKAMETSENKLDVQRNENWLFVRLFNQERSTGFASKAIGGNNEAWIIILAGLVTAAIVIVSRSRVKLVRSQVDNWTLGLICLLILPAFVILFFQSGKASVLPPRDGVRQEDFGCCSQGMIFNRVHVPELVKFLREKKAGQYDLMTLDFAKEKHLPLYAQYPIMMQHIGIHSTRETAEKETAEKETQAVWSMAFESLDAKKLAKEHHRFVDQIYSHRNGTYAETIVPVMPN